MPRLDYLWYEIDAQTKGFDEGILKSGQKLENFVTYVKGAPLVVLGALAAAAIVAGAKIAQMGQEFEYAMARVNTAAQVTKPQLEALGKGVLEISKATGTGLADLTRGLYDIVSSGIPASKALELLNVAAKGAVGGVTNVAVVVDGLTSILNAYRDENLDVAKVQDQMFEAVNKGKITYEELAGSIGQVVGIAATMHISLADLLGIITQLSLQGIKASEAITGVRAAIQNILKPSQEFAQLFPELAAQFNEGRLKGEGFTKFLLDLNTAAKGNNQVLATLFSSVEAYKTVLAALQHNGRDTQSMLNDLTTATGAADAAFKELNETTEQTERRLKAGINTQLTELGTRLLPVKNAVLGFLLELAKLASSATPADIVGPIEQLADKLKGGAFADGSQDLRRLRSEVAILSTEFEDGALSLHRYTSDELKTLDQSLTKIESTYKDLGQTLGPVHAALKQVLDEQARAAAPGLAAEAAARRAELLAHTQQDVTQGLQSGRDILTPPTQSQAYLTALRQRDAATKAIIVAEKELKAAGEDAEQAAVAGDDEALKAAERRAEAARASIEAQRATMKQALGEIYQYDVRLQQLMNGLTGQVGEMLAKATHSAADDLAAQLQKLDDQVAHVRAKGGIVDQDAVDRVHALYAGMILVAQQADETKKVLEQAAHPEGTRGTPEDFDAIASRETQLKLQLNALNQQDVGYADRKRDLEAQINELEKRRTELTDKNLENTKRTVDELARIRNEHSRLIRDQAQAVDSLVKAGVALGEAFGAVSQNLGALLSNLSTIGTNIRPLLDELDKFSSGIKDAHGNPLATFSNIVAAAMPIIGAATSIIGTIFNSGHSPEFERQRQVVAENTAAIQRLTGVMAHFGDVDVAGDLVEKVSAAARGTIALLSTPGKYSRGEPDLAARLAALGLTMEDLDDIAKKLNITIDHSNGAALYTSLQKLLDAIAKAPTTYLDNFVDQLAKLNDEFQVFNITDPIQQLSQLIALLVKTSPAISKALGGIDVTTDQGRADAIAALQALFKQFEAGQLTNADLGGLTREQFVQELEDTLKRLQSGASGVNGTGGYNVDRTITEATGSHVAGLLTTGNVWLQQIAIATAATAAALRGSSLGPLPNLVPPSTTAASGAGIVVNLTLQVVIQPGASIDDARAAGQAIGDHAVTAINVGLGRDVNVKKRVAGNIRL